MPAFLPEIEPGVSSIFCTGKWVLYRLHHLGSPVFQYQVANFNVAKLQLHFCNNPINFSCCYRAVFCSFLNLFMFLLAVLGLPLLHRLFSKIAASRSAVQFRREGISFRGLLYSQAQALEPWPAQLRSWAPEHRLRVGAALELNALHGKWDPPRSGDRTCVPQWQVDSLP